jgi:hypothetical protein
LAGGEGIFEIGSSDKNPLTAYRILVIRHLSLLTANPSLVTRHLSPLLPLTAYRSLFFRHSSLVTRHHSPLTALTAHRLPLTAYKSLKIIQHRANDSGAGLYGVIGDAAHAPGA